VLARHILDRPKIVAGRSVLDLGAGSGIVGIAAARAGAREVIAAEIDAYAVAAIGLNAGANGVALSVVANDLTTGPPPAVDLVVAGDVFYEPSLAERVTGFLDRCIASGIDVLVGDPGRAFLPRAQLRLIVEHPTLDFGGPGEAVTMSGVFSFARATGA
jgi:predicted nicotinamide N-methyase